jgi:hypothetical protein
VALECDVVVLGIRQECAAVNRSSTVFHPFVLASPE